MLECLSAPSFAPLWKAARRRLESNGLSLSGSPLLLRGLTHDEADAVAGLLGVSRPTDGALRVPLVALDAALRASAAGQGLVDVLTTLGGPLQDRRALATRRGVARSRAWEMLERHPAVEAEPRLSDWLSHVRRTGLAQRLAGEGEAEALRAALDALGMMPRDGGICRLAVLASRVTGDAHGLDRGRAPGTLTVHSLAWLAGEKFPRDAAGWRRTWDEAGVACDDLSCNVLVVCLPGWPAEPLRLTLRQVSSWHANVRHSTTVFACENPTVVSSAVDALGDRTPTMVCLDGMPSTAALMVLRGLSECESPISYHGDFDWRGLAIAGVLARKVPTAAPWQYSAEDYRRAVRACLGTVALRGRPVTSPWNEDLGQVMAAEGVAVYEEQVIDDLLDDLASGTTR